MMTSTAEQRGAQRLADKARHKAERKAARAAHSRRPVQHVGTGVVYESVTAAAMAFGIGKKDVSQVCTGTVYAALGHRFRFTAARPVDKTPRAILDRQTGVVYHSARAVARAVPEVERLDVIRSAGILETNRYATARFEYVDKGRQKVRAAHTRRPVRDTGTGVVYESIAAAARAVGRCSQETLCRRLTKGPVTIGGHTLEFVVS